MVKLGHLKDIDKKYLINYIGNTFGNKVLKDISTTLTILDREYGKDRDIYNNDGGYVVLIEDYSEWEIYNIESSGMLGRNNYESFMDIDRNTVRVDYLVNNETMISVYMPRELFKE